MVISRTPLRISFVGGTLTFLTLPISMEAPSFSTAIDKWIHVIVAPASKGMCG